MTMNKKFLFMEILQIVYGEGFKGQFFWKAKK